MVINKLLTKFDEKINNFDKIPYSICLGSEN